MASANRAPIEVQPAPGGEELPSCTGHSALWVIVVYFPCDRWQWETLQQRGGDGSCPLLSFRNLERTSCPFLLWSLWLQSLFQLSRKKNLLSAHFPRSRGIDTVTVLCLAGEIPCILLWVQKIASSKTLQNKVSEHLET